MGTSAQGEHIMAVGEMHLNLLADAVRAGEASWRFEDGDTRYEALLDLEEAGLLGPQAVVSADMFKWQIDSRVLTAVSTARQ
jgi:hypothetical protein